jgi:hypothetical protein
VSGVGIAQETECISSATNSDIIIIIRDKGGDVSSTTALFAINNSTNLSS